MVGALLRREGVVGNALDLAVAYERGEWERVGELAGAGEVVDASLATRYAAAVGYGTTLSADLAA